LIVSLLFSHILSFGSTINDIRLGWRSQDRRTAGSWLYLRRRLVFVVAIANTVTLGADLSAMTDAVQLLLTMPRSLRSS
jgi:hypothetical protein